MRLLNATYRHLVRCSNACLFGLLVLSSYIPGFAQESPVIRTEADTAQIRIGEQINFKITVETDTSAQVIFPEGQTFSPLETVEAFKTDTSRVKDRMILQKIYALTQFDSGNYLLPTQRIEIDGTGYFTDSLLVAVASVPVDTTKQQMYDIKPMIAVEKNNSRFWLMLFLGILFLGLLSWLVYRFFFLKKPLSEEEREAKLPPYDRALLELKKLENSRYLIQDEYKKYYSELTDIVRAYLEEEVQISALESTTRQLIEKLELLKDAGELNLEDETIRHFNKILQTADLVKFARSKPPTNTAEQHRLAVEQIVTKTHEAIPEPSEEELQQQEEYLQMLARQRRKKRQIQYGVAALVIVLLAVGSLAVYMGPRLFWDTVSGHPTKQLLEREWVSSTYGFPPISLESPEVLLREETELSAEEKEAIKEQYAFEYKNPDALFSIGAMSRILNQPVEPDYEKTLESVLRELEAGGARNLITKKEEFTTRTGVKGVKVYGRGTFKLSESDESIRGQYAVFLFGGSGFQQQIVLTWPDGDEYAEKIIERIQNSLEVKLEV
ncbi:MAG: hypothetical protein KJP14_11645 [Eudoraea sp.]|nr:hypothetical protein [Eudoraea sp.]